MKQKLTKEEHYFAFLGKVIHSRSRKFNLSVLALVFDEQRLGFPSINRLQREAKKYGFVITQIDEDEYQLMRQAEGS